MEEYIFVNIFYSITNFPANVLHEREDKSIHEIGLKMGLNPKAMDRILDLMQCAPNHIVAPEKVICAFQEQHN